ncbi:7610_t:CDS:10 [Gigaspora margarita]|uniref:7610_t:CDS:1 n=1 Tax=Gigaspora margarita TaxID=4874 RepID=A0ABM8W5R1_GIGMA|nr:7610_t:CDS:10 [Gigaspora margarita]
MPPTRRQTARSSHPRGRGVLRRLMDPTNPSEITNTNTFNTSVNTTIPSALSSVSQQVPDPFAWTATQIGSQIKLCTIHSVVDLKIENGEEFAFITYTDQALEPEWEPVKNLRNAEALIERSRTSNPVQLDPKPKPILKAVQKAAEDAPDPMQIDECVSLTELNDILKDMDQMCMVNVIPLSYAFQYVIKDGVLQGILSMESDKNPRSRDSFGIEQKWLRTNDLEHELEKLCLLGIVNSENMCNKLGLNPTLERMILIPYNIPEPKRQQNCMDFSKSPVLGIENMDDIDHFMAEVMIQAESYDDVLPQICANNPKFTIYGNPQHSNHKAIIFCMNALGGKYFPIDAIGDETLDLVLVNILHFSFFKSLIYNNHLICSSITIQIEVFWLSQLNFMPNLIRLRHMKRCQFLVYGYDIKRLRPIKFESYFIPGGYLAVSTKVITTESQSMERIFGTTQINRGKWSILLNPKIKTHIDKIMGKNYGAFNAKIKSEEIMFFEEDLWKKSQHRHENNEVGTLYWALLMFYRALAINGNPPRHCVLIIHEDEMKLSHSQIPGVEILTLKEFEKKFDQILQIYE